MLVSLCCRLLLNLEALFLNDLLLQLLLQIQKLFAMKLVLDGIFLRQLAQFDLHLDQFFALCFLTAMYKEL